MRHSGLGVHSLGPVGDFLIVEKIILDQPQNSYELFYLFQPIQPGKGCKIHHLPKQKTSEGDMSRHGILVFRFGEFFSPLCSMLDRDFTAEGALFLMCHLHNHFPTWRMGSHDLGYVVNNLGDRKSPKWGCGTPSKWSKWLINGGDPIYLRYLG